MTEAMIPRSKTLASDQVFLGIQPDISSHIIQPQPPKRTRSGTNLIAQAGGDRLSVSQSETSLSDDSDLSSNSPRVPTPLIIHTSSKSRSKKKSSSLLNLVKNVKAEVKAAFIFDSKIVEDPQQKLLLLEWLLEEQMWGITSILFRGTRDGFASQTFHQLCDSKGSTLVIVKGDNGRVFGGFAHPSWHQSGWIVDHERKTFLFSLERFTKLRLGGKYDTKGEKALCGHPEYGPWFGQSDLRICSQADSRCGSVTQLGFSFSLPPKTHYSGKSSWRYLYGDHAFLINEIEVYKVD